MRKPTKADLAAQLEALRTENSMLRAQIDALRAERDELHAHNERVWKDTQHLQCAMPAPTNKRYPLTDKFGRPYRLEGRVKCFAPGF